MDKFTIAKVNNGYTVVTEREWEEPQTYVFLDFKYVVKFLEGEFGESNG